MPNNPTNPIKNGKIYATSSSLANAAQRLSPSLMTYSQRKDNMSPMLTNALYVMSQAFSVWFATGFFFTIGGLIGFILYRTYRALVKKGAEYEADEILEKVRDAVELRLLEEKERTQEIETELWTREEAALLKTEEHIEE